MVTRRSGDGDAPSGDSAIRDCLVAAIKVTKKALDGVVDTPEVEALLAKRAPLLAQADAARLAGEPWGESEAHLAQKLVELDDELVAQLWGPRADAFGWLTERAPEATEQLPLLTALANRHDAETSD